MFSILKKLLDFSISDIIVLRTVRRAIRIYWFSVIFIHRTCKHYTPLGHNGLGVVFEYTAPTGRHLLYLGNHVFIQPDILLQQVSRSTHRARMWKIHHSVTFIQNASRIALIGRQVVCENGGDFKMPANFQNTVCDVEDGLPVLLVGQNINIVKDDARVLKDADVVCGDGFLNQAIVDLKAPGVYGVQTFVLWQTGKQDDRVLGELFFVLLAVKSRVRAFTAARCARNIQNLTLAFGVWHLL